MRSIGMIERECLRAGKSDLEQCYFINSIAADAKLFARAVRVHWGYKTACIGGLDVIMRKTTVVSHGNAPAC
ncbi:MAG: hypothetical protein LUQ26_13495 [Methylococcaceae bacterium]|nr:hypothetical protein [Methylococcaceae bacterium]MDD1628467.1 hypothetical protein [Methylococcaceae bacterium]